MFAAIVSSEFSEHIFSCQLPKYDEVVTSKHVLAVYRGADKSLARPGRKQARKNARDARDFNNIETRTVTRFFFPARQGAEGNSRHSDRYISLFCSGSG